MDARGALDVQAAGTLSGLYFVTLVIFGAFYVPNLFLAVLWHIYQGSDHRPAPKRPPEGVALRSAAAIAEDGSWPQTSQATAIVSQGRGSLGWAPQLAEEMWREHIGSLRHMIRRVVSSTAFSALSTSLILGNVALLMGEEQPMDPARAAFLERANLVRCLRTTHNAASFPTCLPLSAPCSRLPTAHNVMILDA